MDITKFLFLFLVSLLFPYQSFSQESIVQKTDSAGYYNLSDVVITATRTNISTLELANSISVIDSSEIANSNNNNVFDLLKNEYGLSFTQQGGYGSLSNVNIRGANTGHTLILIDGVEYNLPSDPSGVFDFSSLPSDNIQKIEILRGPQSTIYGSDALAGVINIITKKGTGKPKYSALIEGGSYNTYRGLAGLNGSFKKFNYSLTLSKTKSDGFSSASEKYGNREKDGYDLTNFSSLIGYNISDKAEINLYTRYGKSKADYDQFGGMGGDDPSYVFNQEEFSIRGEGKVSLFNNKWTQTIGASFFKNIRNYSFDTSAASIYYSHSKYDGRKYKLDWQNGFTIYKTEQSNVLLTAGAEFESEMVSSEYYAFTYLDLPDIASIFPEKSANTIGGYIEGQYNAFNSFFTSIGIRYDYHNKFGSAVTYRIAPAYIFWSTGTKLKATIGTGFKSPSIFYLYDPQYGNSGLSPEKSFGWDAGIEQYLWNAGLSIGATYFFNRFSHMFGFDPATFKTININKAETSGLEFFAKLKPITDLELKVNYTYTNTIDKSKGSSDFNQKLLRRPTNKAGLYVSYTYANKFNINAEVIYVGDSEDKIFLPDFTSRRVILNSHTIVNLAVHYYVLDSLRLNLRLDNLFDKYYEEVFGYATPGRSFYCGISLNI
jgi:vitamin B12 transporter